MYQAGIDNQRSTPKLPNAVPGSDLRSTDKSAISLEDKKPRTTNATTKNMPIDGLSAELLLEG